AVLVSSAVSRIVRGMAFSLSNTRPIYVGGVHGQAWTGMRGSQGNSGLSENSHGRRWTWAPPAQGGKIKALGLTSLKRAAAAPDIPTVEESGVKGFAFVSWYGLWGPKNLPADLSNKLQADIAKVLALPDVKQRLNALGFDPIGSGGEQF